MGEAASLTAASCVGVLVRGALSVLEAGGRAEFSLAPRDSFGTSERGAGGKEEVEAQEHERR
jgi:hypothetical protein